MIHHISIAVENPLQVARVLAEAMQGIAYDFPPCPGGYIIFPLDPFGTAIEVYPMGTQILPGQGNDSQSFVPAIAERKFTSVHVAISVPSTLETLQRIGERENWRTVLCDRGPFHVVEFWVENWLMLEFLPVSIASEYLAFAQADNLQQCFGEPVQFAVAA